MKKIIIISLLIFGVFLISHDVWATSVTPAQILVTVNPSEKANVALEIKNDDAKDQKYVLSVVNLKQDSAGRTIFSAVEDNPAIDWITAEEDIVDISAGKSKKVIFNINLPPNALPGSHLAGLSVSPSAPSSVGAGVTGNVVSLLLLQVSGVVRENLNVTRLSHPGVVYNKNIWYSVQLKNEGNVDFPVKGKLNVFGPRYFTEIKDINIGGNILPGAVREIQKDLALGFWPGPYDVRLLVAYGRTGTTLPINFVVWYFPVWSIMVGAVVIVLLFYYFLKRKKDAHNVG